ncbi:MAG: ribonuclease R [Hyphomicrobiales bacterium]
MVKYQPKQIPFPTKEEIIAFIGDKPGEIGTREIARAFNLKNDRRAELKRVLRELADEGRIASKSDNGKKLHHAGSLPSITLADITGRDSDGELIATPTEWDTEAHGPVPSISIAIARKARPGEVAGVGDRALLRVEETGEDAVRYAGRIIKVIDKVKVRALGIFRALPAGGGRLLPIDKKQLGKELAIPPGATKDAQDGDLIAVSVQQHSRLGLPTARVEERLGSIKSERAVSIIAIHAHEIPHVFPVAAEAEAHAAQAADLTGREDWRKLALVTIDPVDAKDHDDAVHAGPDPDPANPGGHILTVAIADVAHYVRPGSALDREAQKRGNSVYFPDRVVPMLPERISNDLCSLRAGENRAALAVRMIISRDGRKQSHTFHRVLMRSAAKLNYQQAQSAISGRPDDIAGPLVDNVLKPLYAAYETLKKARDARGPLDLDLPERKILLKADGTVDRVATPERLESHRLIEEFMILANVAAAETLEQARVPLIYRVHDEPSLEKVEALRQFMATLHISVPKGGAMRAEQFNRILAQVKNQDHEKLVNEVVLRSQSQAEYSAENYGHFGLNLRRYAHFTSPIRRYADLIVHRGLVRAHKFGSDGLPESQDVAALMEISAQISAAERRAMKAERETNDRLIAHHLADRIGASFEGRISGVTRAGLFVKLDDTGADGFIPARTVGNEYFRYEEAMHALVGNRTGETHRLGDRVTVKLVEAAPVAGALRFELLSEGRIMTGAQRSPSNRPGSRAYKPRGRDKPFRGNKKRRR